MSLEVKFFSFTLMFQGMCLYFMCILSYDFLMPLNVTVTILSKCLFSFSFFFFREESRKLDVLIYMASVRPLLGDKSLFCFIIYEAPK